MLRLCFVLCSWHEADWIEMGRRYVITLDVSGFGYEKNLFVFTQCTLSLRKQKPFLEFEFLFYKPTRLPQFANHLELKSMAIEFKFCCAVYIMSNCHRWNSKQVENYVSTLSECHSRIVNFMTLSNLTEQFFFKGKTQLSSIRRI